MTWRNIMKDFRLLIVLIGLFCLVDNANARCNPLKPSTCISNKTKDRFKNSVSKGYFSVLVHNKCSDYVDVTIRYQYRHSDVWNTKTYQFSPGEHGYLIDTDNSFVYIGARSSRVSRQNNYWPKKEIDMGSRFVDYTYNLKC